MQRTIVNIPDPDKRRLKELAEDCDLTVSDLIRRAIAEFLRSNGK
jgi:predicted transcriptional regulator